MVDSRALPDDIQCIAVKAEHSVVSCSAKAREFRFRLAVELNSYKTQSEQCQTSHHIAACKASSRLRWDNSNSSGRGEELLRQTAQRGR